MRWLITLAALTSFTLAGCATAPDASDPLPDTSDAARQTGAGASVDASSVPGLEALTCEVVLDGVEPSKHEAAIRLHLGSWTTAVISGTLYGAEVDFDEEQKEAIRSHLDSLIIDGKLCGVVETNREWHE